MKKILSAVIISFFTFQIPAFSVWIGHDDFEETDDGRPLPLVRHISIHFTEQKPDENRNEIEQGKINFTRKNTVEAVDCIEKLLRPFKNIDSINLHFWEVKNDRHVNLIKQVINSYSFDPNSMEYHVFFHNNVEEAIRSEWEAIDNKKRNEYNDELLKQSEKEQRKEERYNDYLENQHSGGLGYDSNSSDGD